ncbi:MAG: LPS assembly protein LptD [Desulfobacteraceae bacterium]|nr:LPS assembly protein LptD [Desulfobacteraceae bacterium]
MQGPRPLIIFLYLAAAMACIAGPYTSVAPCQEFFDQVTQNGETWRITADKITYHPETNRYTASGNVGITRDKTQLLADKIILDKQNMKAVATGSVTLVSEGDRLTGERLDMDLESATGTLYQGHIFIRENNFRIRGERIEKTGENTYHITDGSLTSCEGPRPDWQITGKQVDVTIEGYGYVSHAALWARRLPVFYVPWFMFPVKLKRQSGLLMPEARYSDRKGAEYIQPLFWAISGNTDATFYYHHMQKRGEKFGLEYRYMFSEDSKGTLMADGFKDKKIDDGSREATAKWGYDDDEAARPNDDRYWIRMKADQQLFAGATARLDIDIVSDQDYLREFSDRYMGHETAADYFSSEFGRDLDDKNDPVRTNRLNINRSWSYQSLNADLVWYDNVINRRLKDEDDTLQQLPRIQYSALKQPLTRAPAGDLLFGSLDSEYTYFYSRDNITGHRMDLHPRLYLPLRAGHYFSLEPSAGFRQTAWYIDADSEFYSDEKELYMHRELYDAEMDLSTEINRVFSVEKGRVEKIRHVIIPRLSYDYIPEKDQSEYPEFDEIDRIEPENSLALSFTNLFTSKASLSGKNRNNEKRYTYNRVAKFFIEQAYNFREDKDSGQAWMPLYAELDLTPANLLTLHADASWDHQNDELDTGNLTCRLYDRRGDELKLEYRYSRDSTKSIDLYAKTRVTRNLAFFGNYERNLETETDIEKGLGMRYESQCWALELAWKQEGEEEDNDTRYMAMIELFGLGGFGETLDNR